MKRLAMLMAVILGIIPGITPQTAYSDRSADPLQTRIITENSTINGATEAGKMQQRNIIEVNFSVRVFLWALDRRQSQILTKIISPVFRTEFANTQAMMIAMTLVHGPVIGAKNVFLHTPEFNNDKASQEVYFTGRFGNPWKATYMLRRDKNGLYGIAGCTIKKLAGEFS